MFGLRNVRQIGPMVRGARKRKSMTQAELAEKIGVTREWINRLENGTMPNPGLRQILDLFALVDLKMSVTVPSISNEEDPYTAEELKGLSLGRPDFSQKSRFKK